MLDNIKALGFKYSTLGAITISISDMTVPEAKRTLINETEQKVINIEKQYKRGFITNEERYRLVVEEWERTTKAVTDALQDSLDEFNPIYMMANSGARGSMNQIRQLAGMRGLMANTAGKTIENTIKANSARASRFGILHLIERCPNGTRHTRPAYRRLRYLTRPLVDCLADVILRSLTRNTRGYRVV